MSGLDLSVSDSALFVGFFHLMANEPRATATILPLPLPLVGLAGLVYVFWPFVAEAFL